MTVPAAVRWKTTARVTLKSCCRPAGCSGLATSFDATRLFVLKILMLLTSLTLPFARLPFDASLKFRLIGFSERTIRAYWVGRTAPQRSFAGGSWWSRAKHGLNLKA